jgi:ABC-2 type transport system ATP-binding protein
VGEGSGTRGLIRVELDSQFIWVKAGFQAIDCRQEGKQTMSSIPVTAASSASPIPPQGQSSQTPRIERPVDPATVAIDVQKVRHGFRGRNALQGISFQVATGSLHGFVGPNGAGKTTTLKLICTLLAPQFGSIRVFGHHVVDQIREVRRVIGFMPDHFSTYRQMSVAEYLDFFAAAYGLPAKRRDQVIDEVLQVVDMEGRRSDLISGLSRGMQQRVGLARVLVNDPSLLLLDEPASGLDPRARIELMEILKALKSMGKTIFISSHILSELADLCDSVTIIDLGEIKYSGQMDSLLVHSGPLAQYRLTVEGSPADAAERLKSVPGVEEVQVTPDRPELRVTFDAGQLSPAALIKAAVLAEIEVTACQPERRHLNDAFMELTGARGKGL